MAKKQPHTPKTYPTPEELPQMIARRRELAERIMLAMVLQAEDEAAADGIMEELVRTFGRAEVARMLARVMANLERPEDPAAEATQLYNAYVATWRRFGGERPLLSIEEHRRLRDERANLRCGAVSSKGAQLSVDSPLETGQAGRLLLGTTQSQQRQPLEHTVNFSGRAGQPGLEPPDQ